MLTEIGSGLNFKKETAELNTVVQQVLKTLKHKNKKSHVYIEDKIWFINSNVNPGTFHALNKELEKSATIINVSGDWNTTGYSAIAPLVRKIISFFIENKEVDHLETMGPEILYLFPNLEGKYPFVNIKDLEEIALTPSRRRLHKESEQMFRVTQMIVTLITKYVKKIGNNVIFIFNRIDKMDEHSIRCFSRLSKCIDNVPVVILATLKEAEETDSRFRIDSKNEFQKYVSLAANRNNLLQLLYEQLKPKVFEVDESDCINDEKCNGDSELLLHKEYISSSKLLKKIKAMEVEDIDEVLMDALKNSLFTQNYENTLSLVDKVTPFMYKMKNHVVVEVWIHVAICYAYMLEFEKSLEIFKHALSYAQQPLQKAELYLYIALLYTKRLKKPIQGREIINEALSKISGETGATAEVERSWLHNLKALTFVETKEINLAFNNCRKGLELIKNGDRSEDAIHIKINLLSNITVLYEFTQKVDAALKYWLKFDQFVNNSSPVFAKHYLYRKAGLFYKSSNFPKAVQALKESFKLAKEMNDFFHMDIIARGIGAIYFELNKYEDASEWYKTSLNSKYELVQDDELPRVGAALALCFEKLGDVDGAKKILEEVLMNQNKSKAAELALELLKQLSGKKRNRWDEIEEWAIQKPETKLNRPFDLTNMYIEKVEK